METTKAMSTGPQGFISPLLLALIGVLIIGGGAYVYVEKKQGNQLVTSSNQATSTAQSALTSVQTSISIDTTSLTTSSSQPVIAGVVSGATQVTVGIWGKFSPKSDMLDRIVFGKAQVTGNSWRFIANSNGLYSTSLRPGSYIVEAEILNSDRTKPVAIANGILVVNSGSSFATPVSKTVAVANGFVIDFENETQKIQETNPSSILSLTNIISQNDIGTDLTGWRIESRSTGLFFKIPTVTKSVRYGQHETILPKNITLWPGDTMSIFQQETADENFIYPTDVITSYGVYIPKGKDVWNTSHDTITVRDTGGNIVGQFTY